MFIEGWINRAHINQIPLLLFSLGLIAFIFSTKTPHGGIAYRGIMYYIYGKKAWNISNKLIGSILMVISIISYLLFKFINFSTDIKVIIIVVSCFFSIILTEVITYIYLKKKL